MSFLKHFKQPFKPTFNQLGFSLTEVILVIMVTGFMVILISSLPFAFNVIGSSRSDAIAKQIISRQIEKLRSLTYDNLANSTNLISDPDLTKLPSSTGSVTISNCPPNICSHNELIKQVQVVLNWKENGKDKRISASTFISQGGLK